MPSPLQRLIDPSSRSSRRSSGVVESPASVAFDQHMARASRPVSPTSPEPKVTASEAKPAKGKPSGAAPEPGERKESFKTAGAKPQSEGSSSGPVAADAVDAAPAKQESADSKPADGDSDAVKDSSDAVLASQLMLGAPLQAMTPAEPEQVSEPAETEEGSGEGMPLGTLRVTSMVSSDADAGEAEDASDGIGQSNGPAAAAPEGGLKGEASKKAVAGGVGSSEGAEAPAEESARPHAAQTQKAVPEEQPSADSAAENAAANAVRAAPVAHEGTEDGDASVTRMAGIHVEAPRAVTGGQSVAPMQAPQAPTPPPEAEFAQANHASIVQGIRGQLLPNGGSMHIRLDPPELGALQVSVHLRDGMMTASFQTSSDDAARLLSHSLSQLKHALESQGVQVEKIHVEQTARADHRGAGQEGDARQQGQGGSEQSEQQRREMLRRLWRRVANGADPLDLVA